MFSSLANRNYRIYFIAISFSVIGTFAQELALAWLVLELTHSAALLGLVVGLQFLPMLVITPWGGVLSDRFNRRNMLFITQSSQAILGITLWSLTVTGQIQVWMVCIFALLTGLVASINTPTRLGFLHELVGDRDLHNAISLNSSVYSMGRLVGPALAGILITFIGIAPAFLINTCTFLGVIFALSTINPAKLHLSPKSKSENVFRQLRAGLSHVRHSPLLLGTLTMALILGIFTYEFPVTLAALAKLGFNGNAGALAILSCAFGIGAVAGGLFNARRGRTDPSALPIRVVQLGLAVILVALMPTLWLAAAALLIVGFCTLRFASFANATLQLAAAPELRGRVIALWASAWVGSTAIGAPIVGWVAQTSGPRWALALGGIAALVAAGVGYTISNRAKEHSSPAV